MVNSFKINDLVVEYEIIHRRIKYPRLEIKTDYLYLILPEGYNNHQKLLKKHENWIYRKISRVKMSQKKAKNRCLNLERSDEEFKEMVLQLVKNISSELNVTVNQVRFRRMKSRWGSCSLKGNLNINRYLKYLPPELIEYIVFHEIAHLIEMGHNKRFWNLIAERFNDYQEIEDELLVHWLLVKDLVGIA